jgi:HD-like signal output (HDOD) protein
MINESAFLEELQSAIANNKITLPTLPEVALRVRDTVEQENVTAKETADIVATDAALAARLLQIANSPLYRGRVVIENIQMAVTRLGNKLVRSLVVSLIMKQIFQATSDALDKRMRKLWEDSVQIAAISRVLAKQLPELETEQALLAGLIHDIGALPILAWAEGVQELVEDEHELDRLLEKLSPIVGKQILETWQFPQALIDVAANSHNYYHDGGSTTDYVDVVVVARLQLLAGNPHIKDLDWSRVSAFSKVGLESDIQVVDIEGVAEDIAQVEEIFLG